MDKMVLHQLLSIKKMFELMSKVKGASDKETQQYLNLIKKLDNLKSIYNQVVGWKAK